MVANRPQVRVLIVSGPSGGAVGYGVWPFALLGPSVRARLRPPLDSESTSCPSRQAVRRLPPVAAGNHRLPESGRAPSSGVPGGVASGALACPTFRAWESRSEEHTSE